MVKKDLSKGFSLCVCAWGHSRSVCLTRVLHEKGYQAVACGCHSSPAALAAIAKEAEHIFILQGSMLGSIPLDQQHKVIVVDVGPDRWVNPYNQELHQILQKLVYETCGV